jgi:2-iminobutanoate/2-iminopropanoate deaminase
MSRESVNTPKAPSGRTYSQAVVVGDMVFVAGTVGKDMTTGTWPVGIRAQMEQALANVAAVLAEAGCTMADVVKTTTFITPEADAAGDDADLAEDVYLAAFAHGRKPARSSPVVGLPVPEALVSIEAIAVRPDVR